MNTDLKYIGTWRVENGIATPLFDSFPKINGSTLIDGIYTIGVDVYIGKGFAGMALFKLKTTKP